MSRENQTKAWCAKCRQYQPTTTKKHIISLPCVLLINSGAASSDEATIWRQNGPAQPKKAQSTEAQEGENANNDTTNIPSSWVPER